jgi:hypothetical protein
MPQLQVGLAFNDRFFSVVNPILSWFQALANGFP